MRVLNAICLTGVGAVALTGCYNELDYMTHRDLKGTVTIPAEYVSLEILDADDALKTLEDDPRVLGPVYLGVFASVRDDLYNYPHPEIGPILDEGTEGNTYPYGGTTIGRFDWGCYQQMKCKLVTGRYEDYDEVLDFFAEDLESPVTNDGGDEVTSGIELRERCYEVNYLTGDAEVRFVGPLDFERSSNGDYVAEVEILHTDFREGVEVWGWMDMPNSNFDFRTCDSDNGEQVFYYDDSYEVGTNFSDVLNFPGKYIGDGDLVAEEAAVVNDSDKEFSLTLGLKIDE